METPTHLECEFVLVLVCKCPHLGDNIAQVVFDKENSGTELSSDCLFVWVWSSVIVITGNKGDLLK